MLLWTKQPSPLHPPRPPQKENYFVRKFMVCLFIDCLNLEYGQCSLFLSRLLFSTWGCWKEDRRQHEKRDALLSLRPSQVLCCICLQQKFVKFPLQLWRYRCVTETWLPWAAAMWSSNGANNVCSSFNFASASLWDKQGSKEENKIIRLAWISTAWKGYEFHW